MTMFVFLPLFVPAKEWINEPIIALVTGYEVSKHQKASGCRLITLSEPPYFLDSLRSERKALEGKLVSTSCRLHEAY